MSLQTVIIQNQQTIAFLEAKDYCSALVSSSSALQCLDSVPPPTQQEQNDTGNRFCPARSSSFSSESSIDQCMLHIQIQEDDYTCGTQTFMYSHAIPLPPDVTDHDIITSILIFNTALAHHLVALLDNEWSPQYLHRAKQLYTLAYNSSQEVIEHNPLFLFVVYNNTALLANLQIGDKDLRNSCVGYLVSIYMVMVDEGYTSRLRHLQGFLESLVASMPTTAAAA
ncbi:unnamed protein product [Cylindrotheca closterium]|uniref:Uncharacterized protein n=1 Tax=Cylindrotheca closterium TaxID=2856 RepID=A0AAD2G7R8_9STRA|nr:unnamed protein product [Cylindrotheca closterium]